MAKAIQSLDTMMGGSVRERFNRELNDVLRNALDPNTKAKTKRQIHLVFDVTPDKARKTASIDFDCYSKTARPEPVTSTCYLERDDKGRVVAYEDQGQLDGQLSTDDMPAADAPTGDGENNVIKFTAAK